MAPDPRCAALAAAKLKKGLSYAQIASAVGATEDRVVAICTGSDKATEEEFKSLAQILGITDNVSHTGVHSTK